MAVLWAVSTVFVALRVLGKMITRTFCTEDHLVIAAVVLSVAPVACVVYSEFVVILLLPSSVGSRTNECMALEGNV